MLQFLAARTDVGVVLGVVGEVGPLEGSVLASGLIDDGDVWGDATLPRQPVEHLTCAIGGIGDQAFGRQIEGVAHPIHHGPHSPNFGLPDRAGRLDIEDDAIVGVDQIVRGICEVGGSAPRSSPLRGRIGVRGELRLHRAGRTEGGIIQRIQIFSDRARRVFEVDLLGRPVDLRR